MLITETPQSTEKEKVKLQSEHKLLCMPYAIPGGGGGGGSGRGGGGHKLTN